MNLQQNKSKLSINLRTLLVIVICLTGISVIYQYPLVQVILLSITMLLLFILRPSAKAKKQLMHRISRIGRIILVIFIFQLLFRRTGNVIFEYSILRITDIGINYALASSLRFFLIILVAGLLMDCPFQEYLIALNAWKFPYEIAFIVAATIHFLPVFKRIFQNKMETLALRNISLKKITLPQRLHIFKILLIPILATAIQNLQNQAISLELRAFRLHPTRTYLHENKLHAIDIFIIIITLCISLITLIILT
jgi:energy-coupling factor transport system permease protein